MATFTLNGTKSIVKPTLDVIRSLSEIMIRKITFIQRSFHYFKAAISSPKSGPRSLFRSNYNAQTV